MKKTLIALALSTVPLAVMAEVTLYGEIKGGLEYSSRSHVSNTITNVNDWGSYIGFKGEEDLGNGLKALWQIEQNVSLDTNSPNNSRWASRDSFIGLSGDFGTLRTGYLSDVFKSNMEELDQWEGNGIRTLSSITKYGGRYTGIRYDTPNWTGLTLSVLYSPEDNLRYNQARHKSPNMIETSLAENNDGLVQLSDVINNSTSYKDILSVGLGYENSGWFVKYGYKNFKNNLDFSKISASSDGEERDHRLNGEVHGLNFGYDDGTLFAGLAYRHAINMQSSFYVVGTPDNMVPVGVGKEDNDVALTFAYTSGNMIPRISFAYGESKDRNIDHPTKNKYSQIIAGVDYNLSKRTAVLASLGYWTDRPRSWVEFRDQVTDVARKKEDKKYKRNEHRTEDYSVGLGLRHKF